MHSNIDYINTTVPTVDYSNDAVREYDMGMGSRIDDYIAKFEQEHTVSDGLDIGGLIVYSQSCVYDYENFVGWVK